MEQVKFHILDVFTEKKYAGNQLAVVESYGKFSSKEMQNLAREFHFSETTFIESGNEETAEYEVRIFTIDLEVPFAGHPTLGTAWIIRNEILGGKPDKVTLNLKAGDIPVFFSGDEGEMVQLPPVFSDCYKPSDVATILGIEEKDILTDTPIETVSTGVPFIMVPLGSLIAVKKCNVHTGLLYDFVKDKEAQLIFVFTKETQEEENHMHARMFGHYYGVPEDPATGSANGCFAGYLLKHGVFGKDNLDIRVEQGYEISRPSILKIKASWKDEQIEVRVGGNVIKTCEGFLV